MTDNASKRPDSVYERVIVAAREAKRLNTQQQYSNVTPKEKVTTEAIQRMDSGEIDYETRERQAADTSDEPSSADDEEADSSWKH